MAINPNIILSGNQMAAPQLPDVNAMMQTRTAGMKNIYALEQQRAAQAQAAQKEQAAAQEAALTQALLPAYTYGIQTGDIAGAFDLVPPEMQANLAPYVQALEGKNPEEVRSALIGSLSASKAGQEALAAMQRAETIGVQRGQLEVSRANAAREAAAAARGPKPEFEIREVEGLGFVRINRATGEVFPITYPDTTAAGGGIPGPRAEPVPAPTMTAPISTQQPPKGSVLQPKAKEASEKTKELREQEAKSLDLAAQMTQANKITDELDAKGVRTSDALVSFTEGLFAALPDAAGRNLADQVRAVAENLLPSLSADEQRLARAQIQFVDAVLRSRSGAEIKTSEFPSMYRVFFPTEADENIPEIVADKKVSRRLAVDTMRAKSGTLGTETLDRILRENGVLPPAPVSAPAAPGATFEGFEVLGEEPEQ